MKKTSFTILLVIISPMFTCKPKNDVKQHNHMQMGSIQKDTVVKIDNSTVELLVNLNGGSYFDFHLKNLPLNPISYRGGTKPEERIFMGHFLCFDRWGSPSAAEKANGFRHHGEVNTQLW